MAMGNSNLNVSFFGSKTSHLTKTKVIILILILIAGGVGFYFVNRQGESDDNGPKADKFNRHTVVSNGPECAPIGM